MDKIYDVIIIGAGPGGLAAGLYAGRANLSTLIIEKGQGGGQIAETDSIENYPGQLLEGETGITLTERMAAQCEAFGCERVRETVKKLTLNEEIKTVTCRKKEFKAKTVILATGANPRPIGCLNEALFKGAGVSYCATCDGNFFKDKEVFVVGGGDAAVEEAMYLTKFAKKVSVIHRRNELRAAKSIQDRAFKNEKMHFIWDSVVEELDGDGMLQKMVVRNVKTDEKTTYTADPEDGMFGVFGFIGRIPNTKICTDTGLTMTEQGYIPTDEEMRTNLPGVYAVGDIRVKTLRQVITAAADGAIAAIQAEKYIAEG